MERLVYADNAATTKISETAFSAMLPFLRDGYGNPSSIYSLGRDAKAALESARSQVAKAINAEESEIYFTSCGTEAINWALKSGARAMRKKGKTKIISSKVEHHAVLCSLDELRDEGFEIVLTDVDEKGLLSPESVKEAVDDKTALVSVMTVNNELGTIQPVSEVARIARGAGVWFHTDAVQAIGHMAVDVKEIGADFLSLSGHKFNAPKGVGALYIKKGVKIPAYMTGGSQERKMRAGTENVAQIAALGAAIEEAVKNLEKNTAHVKALSTRLIDGIMEKIPYTRFNGDREKKIPGTNNFAFQYIEGEALLLMLDMAGICASSGSACTSGSLDPSHVLLAIGLPHEIAHGSLRLSLGHENTMEDVDYILEKLPGIVGRLRDMSPLYEAALKKG